MLLRFGDCELDLASREVRVAGEPRAIEPRAYALLAFLAERRNRVVTKQELLAAVWAGQRVSDASIARAVMKARQAIGDSGDPPLIRTIPRVGYRLSVTPQAAAKPDPAVSKAAAASPAPLRIALLPFVNATADPSLDWMEYGLMSLVVHAISQDARLSPVATQSLLAAVDGAQATGADMAETVRRATGAQVVIRSHLSRRGDGYELTFECVGTAVASTLSALNLTDLAASMPIALEELLFPGTVSEAPQAYVGDPLAVAAFGRGLQALARQKFSQAANLLRMALDLAPGTVAIQLELLRALCAVPDLDAARPLVRRLFARAERDGDLLLTARVHTALATAYAFQSSFPQASYHIELALRVMGTEAPIDEQASGYMMRARLAGYKSDHVAMERALDRTRQLCEQSGNRLGLLERMIMLALTAASRADYEVGAELTAQAAQGAQDLHVPRLVVSASIHCAAHLGLLGRWQEAAAHVEDAFAAALLLNNAASLAQISPGACWIYRLTGTPAASQRIIDALPPDDKLPTLARGWTLFARGSHAAALGDHELAAQFFGQTIRLFRETGNQLNQKDTVPPLIISLVLCGRLEEAEAEIAGVLQSAPASDHDASRWLLHSQALLAHARDDRERALELLLQLAEAPTAPLWRAWAVLDAAWLQAEAGQGVLALALLRRLPPAFASHALTHAVTARSQFACGDAATASRLHQLYLDSARHRTPQPYLVGLGQTYAGTGTAGPAPCLPSQL